MKRSLKTLRKWEMGNSISSTTDSTDLVKENLKTLSKSFVKYRSDFQNRHTELVSQFPLSDDEKRGVLFKLKTPENKSLRKYINVLNKDPQLNFLDNEIDNILKTGNLLILNLLKEENIQIQGYHIDKFLSSPEKYKEDIYNLIKGLYGYEHCHLIDDLILLEVPARVHIADYPAILELVDTWVNGLEIFAEE